MLKKMKNTTKIIIISTILYMLLGIIIYPLIPNLLNYPANSLDNDFQVRVAGIKYTTQFIFIMIFMIIVNAIAFYILFRKLNNVNTFKKDKSEKNIKNILNIRNICFNGIYKLMPIQVLVTLIIMITLLSITKTEVFLTLKLTGIICIWVVVSSLILNVFISKLFNKILVDTYFYVQDIEKDIKKISIRDKILFQSVTMMVVILFVLSLFAYSRITIERSYFLKEKEYMEINKIIEEKQNNIFEYIKTSNENYFILDKNFKTIYSKKELSKFFTEYIKEYPMLNKTYMQYGSTIEGVYVEKKFNNDTFYIGKVYEVMPINYGIILLMFDISLLLLYILIINFFAKEIKDQLMYCSEKLYNIGTSKVDICKQLEVTSNDEFRDLIQAYNFVQKNTNRFIKDLNNKQDVIVKQGQLVSIGELAGGVAHDINTPISGIKTGLQMLTEMDTPRSEVETELLYRMTNCADKIIKIVNSMRNQIRNLGSDQMSKFKISTVIEDIRIIAYNEIQKNHCELIVNIVDDVSVYGDPTKLGQVFTNLIVNAVQAYDEKGGKVEIIVTEAPNNKVMIRVKDYAGGIPENIKEFVFKNILTTKGTKGTGLGLYLAYSVIKGEFSGEISFDSKVGEGTTFIITLNKA